MRNDETDESGERPDCAGDDCQDALDTLYRFLDGELTDQRRILIQEHLERCSSCLDTFDFEADLKVVIATRCREVVPEGLRQRVAVAIYEASVTRSGPE